MSVKSDLHFHGEIKLEPYDSKETRELLSTVWPVNLKAAKNGVVAALSSGPLLSFPV